MSSRGRTVGRAVVLPLVWAIRLYQRFISPLRPPTCRYYPSCSAYAVTALERFGPFRGAWMGLRRLLRCHPWTFGGVDHVPDRDPVTGRPVPGTTGPKPYRPEGSDAPDTDSGGSDGPAPDAPGTDDASPTVDDVPHAGAAGPAHASHP